MKQRYSFRRSAITNADDSKVPADEELIRELAAGRREAIGPLYARYAPLLFGMAAHALDHATAEEVVQDVFLAVWKNAASFDPARGPVRPWLLQIAHFRIANELRHRSRRPRAESDPEGTFLATVPDPGRTKQSGPGTSTAAPPCVPLSSGSLHPSGRHSASPSSKT